jgi:predicted transcriptional regulator
MKTLKIGIAPQEKIRERILGIARGKIKPKASDPKIWFHFHAVFIPGLER